MSCPRAFSVDEAVATRSRSRQPQVQAVRWGQATGQHAQATGPSASPAAAAAAGCWPGGSRQRNIFLAAVL